MAAIIQPFTELTKHLTAKAEKQPGWLYLLICTYLIVGYYGVPARVVLGPWSIALPRLSEEIWVVLVTYVVYQAGDVLDKITFKKRGDRGHWDVQRYQPRTFKNARAEARRWLGIQDGSYRVALSVLEAAEEGGLSVHFINESAKFLRSLIIPAYAASLIVAFTLPFGLRLALVTVSTTLAYVVAYHAYPWLKTLHMTNLYKKIPAILKEDKNRERRERKLFVQDVGEIRLFLWDGSQIATARRHQ